MVHRRLPLAVLVVALVGLLAPAASAAAGNWTTYHQDTSRTGFDATAGHVNGPLRPTWRVTLDGAVYAEPLVVNGIVIAATEGGSLYGIAGGKVLWRRHIAAPQPQSGLPCGNIDPLGITGTPAYDPVTNRVFAVTETANPTRHILVAVDPRTGKPLLVRTLDPSPSIARYEQQRAALTVSHGRVYVAYGGLAGDCGPYHGYVVGVPTNGGKGTVVYRTPSAREAGIWAPSGPAADSDGYIYVAVGNGASTSTYDYSDSILKLTPTLRLASYFSPAQWAAENANDADLGSTGPALLPGGRAFADGKGGTAYVLNRGNLGGIGHPISQRSLCRSFGGTAFGYGRLYVPCTDGVRAVGITRTGSIVPLWQAAGISGSPVVGGGAVWSLDTGAGRLYELSPSTGRRAQSASVGAVSRFATPTLHGSSVFVGTLSGVVAFHTS